MLLMADTRHLAVIVNDEVREESREAKPGEDLLDGSGHRIPAIWSNTRPPTIDDDETGVDGDTTPVKPGDFWRDTATGKLYVCFVPTTGSAAWQDMTVPPPFDPQDLIDEINNIQGELQPRPGASYYSSTAATNSGGTATTMPINVTSNEDTGYYARAGNEVEVLAPMRLTIIANITLYNTNKSAASMARYWLELDDGSGWGEVAGTEGYLTASTKQYGNTGPLDITIPVEPGDLLRVRFQRVQGTALISTLDTGCRLRLQSEGVETIAP